MVDTTLSRNNLNKIVESLTNNNVPITRIIKSYSKSNYYGEILIRQSNINYLNKILSDLPIASIKFSERFNCIVIRGEYLDSPY